MYFYTSLALSSYTDGTLEGFLLVGRILLVAVFIDDVI
jgi:hypothetical protein